MILAVMGAMSFSALTASAQDEAAATDTTEAAAADEGVAAQDADTFNAEGEVALHQALKTKFIEGGAGFMALVIICLILGLALAIERILYLAFAKTNTEKLLKKVNAALEDGGYAKAYEVCTKERGPVATIYAAALHKLAEGGSVEDAEKLIVSYGGIEASKMESGLSWISLFIAIAPSLGFLGTVIGMIQAFDAIQVAGDMSPNVVAGGMKVALITTVGGLIVAVILQLFYNYILSQIDSLSIEMEEASTSVIETVVKYQSK